MGIQTLCTRQSLNFMVGSVIGAVALSILGLLGVSLAEGQSRAAPSFEVASVKAVVRRGGNSEFSCANGRFVSRLYPPRFLILWAWGLDNDGDRLKGLPSWAAGPGPPWYEIEARASSPVSEETCRLMLRTLLADRFHVATHEEDRTVDAYALVVAKGGPELTPVTDPNAPPNGPGFTMDGQPNQIYSADLKGWSMEQLASALSMNIVGLGRPVIDRTGLKGIYRIDLRFRVSPEGDGQDIRTEIQRRLGLQLTPRKEAVKVLVVDHIQQPDPN